ncbi:DUF1294 domain-containing protein [Flavobacterium amniphilum]|uniref:DUF1294 domain-containing protein n=1 Tax=Flavobacterium amniphilum TaxID=1834035 RepID=UPI00202A929A|nr:DUF1294 domain-containing protein [Flavobacterium amniphilum]MCL9804114.1 DUF1294 domain-containing protein [Flavobacterium amniphilum]
MKIILLYILCINLLTLGVFGADKFLAVKNKRRIPEKDLLAFCIIGGAIGGLLGMFVFKHKTSKPSFLFRFGFIFVCQILLFYFMRF